MSMKTSKMHCVDYMKRNRLSLVLSWRPIGNSGIERMVFAGNTNKDGGLILFHATVLPNGEYTICRVLATGDDTGKETLDPAHAIAARITSRDRIQRD